MSPYSFSEIWRMELAGNSQSQIPELRHEPSRYRARPSLRASRKKAMSMERRHSWTLADLSRLVRPLLLYALG
jgi:hypothetical protein